MQRFQLADAATLTHTVLVGETATNPNPDEATVTVTAADGTVIAAAAAATKTGTGTFSYTVPAADVDRLDTWTIQWTTLLGAARTATDYAEIVGGFLFTIAELRALDPLSNETAYPLAALLEKRTLAETLIEDACGRAFVPRYRQETRRMRRGRVFTSRPDVRAVRAFQTTDGTPWVASTADLAAVSLEDDGFTTSWSSWGASGRVLVGYEHGTDYPPADVKRAALQLARYFLVEGPSDPRVITQTGDFGSSTLWTPGVRGAITPLPEVDAVIRRYADPVVA